MSLPNNSQLINKQYKNALRQPHFVERHYISFLLWKLNVEKISVLNLYQSIYSFMVLWYIKLYYSYLKIYIYLVIFICFILISGNYVYCDEPIQCVYWPEFLGGFDNYPLVVKYADGIDKRIVLANYNEGMVQFDMSADPQSRDARVIKTLCIEALNDYHILLSRPGTIISQQDEIQWDVLLEVNKLNGVSKQILLAVNNSSMEPKGFTTSQISAIHNLSRGGINALTTSPNGISFDQYIIQKNIKISYSPDISTPLNFNFSRVGIGACIGAGIGTLIGAIIGYCFS